MATTAVTAWYDGEGWGARDQKVTWIATHADGLDVEAAMRAAVKDFFTNAPREDVAAALEQANDFFNWGDAMLWIDAETWAKHGLVWSDEAPLELSLDHDETLSSPAEWG